MTTASAVNIGTLISATEGVNGGRPCIAGTGMSVHQVAVRYLAGLSPEEIVREYPGLRVEGVYAAISHYLANRERIDQELADEAAEGAAQLAAQRASPSR